MKLLNPVRNLLARLGLPESRGFWLTTAALILAAEILLTFIFWDWLSGGESGSTTIRNIGFIIAGSVALPLAIWRGLVADTQATASQHQADTAQQSSLNERYERGAEMLGSNAVSVRLSGIYALERLANEDPEQYHVQIMKLFCAFVRNQTGTGQYLGGVNGEVESNSTCTVRADVQEILTAVGGRSQEGIGYERAAGFRLELRGANLAGAFLPQADFAGADLRGANLVLANLPDANLSNAFLAGAVLSDQQLQVKTVSGDGTDNVSAGLLGAFPYETDVSGAWFSIGGMLPARGLIQERLDKAYAEPDNPPKLDGVVDAVTGKPLVWRGCTRKGEQSN